MIEAAPQRRKMSEVAGNMGLGRAWKGFRSTVSLRKNSLSDTLVDAEHRDPNGLKPVLPSWQILTLAISGIIGMTIWQGTGLILHISGPAGLLAAVGFVGITCISVMEALSEMIILWPVAMGLYEYVRAFVDHDLAIVIGVAYWYSWSSVFGTLLVAAANLATYWEAFENSHMWQSLLFYIICPISMLLINCLGVSYYGWLEGIGGLLKLFFVVVGMLYLFVTSGKVGSKYFDDEFQFNALVTDNKISAVCLVIPLMTYGFLGVESITTTAFEAADRNALRFPSRYIAYLITLLYFLSALGQAHTVSWTDPSLPSLRTRAGDVVASTDTPESQSVIVLAAQAQNEDQWAAFFTGTMIFFCLSSANTALYISSRTLYGLTRSLGIRESKWYLKWLAIFGTATPISRVPGWALLVSAVAFCWLPFLHLGDGFSSQDVLVIMSTIGSVGCVIVWASQCLAYIRCWRWFRHHSQQGNLPSRYDRWRNQWDPTYMSTFSYLQPFPAALGLVCCCLIIFVFSTATWWNGEATFRKVAAAYAGPLILLVFFVALKIRNRRGCVRLHPVYTGPLGLSEVLNRLERNAQTEVPTGIEARELDEIDDANLASSSARRFGSV